jgi:hypothetical protein
MSRSLVTNPAWVGQALADTYEWLQQGIPSQWLPLLASVKSDGAGAIVGEVKEYGCGAYGCVIPTLDPKIVMKLTADETEAEFAAMISYTPLVAQICVRYPMVVETPVKDPKGARVYFLWRDAAAHVGELKKRLGRRANAYIKAQHDAGDAAYRAIYNQEPNAGRLMTLWAESCEAMARQTEVPELRALGEGLVEVWGQQGILFGDIHPGNLGLVEGRWVVTDPGHIVVVDRELVANPAPDTDVVADIINDAARRVAVGPGRAQAYIEEVWQQVKRDGKDSGYSYDQYKCEIIRLQQAGLIRLARAQDGRSKLAKASEVRIEREVFHMVIVENPERAAPAQPTYGPVEDAEFIATVNQVASQIGPEGRMGDRKVFISEVWDVVSEDPRYSRMGVDAFKDRLLAHRDKILLARADLVAAMDPALVEASETGSRALGATYHFVVDPRFGAQGTAKTAVVAAQAPAGDRPELLEAVQQAILRIGPSGRFGPYKVFVSEIWRSMQDDPRAKGLSLDQFKRWLLIANRDSDLTLARADLVGAMNPKLVADSEITDRGATFHFVIDPDQL